MRRKNEDTIAAAQAAAREIMLENGYDAASYSAISERTGIARTTVQHYFPSKTMLATGLLHDIEVTSHVRALEALGEEAPSLAVYYLTAQISYGIFYQTTGTRRFLLDLVVNRDLQHEVAPDYIASAAEMTSLGPLGDEDLFNLHYAIGGVYEMHYLALRSGEEPPFARLILKFVSVLADILGMSREEYDRIVAEYTMDNDELLAIGKELLAKL